MALTPPLFLLALALPVLTQAQQRCQWATLRSATDMVLESLAAGINPNPSDSTILSSPSLVYTQNALAIPITSPRSLLAKPLSVAHAHSIVDQDACAGFVKLVVNITNTTTTNASSTPSQDASQPSAGAVYVIGAQIYYNYTTMGTFVRQMDLVFAGPGDWQMPGGSDDANANANATAALVGHIRDEDWGALSRVSQDTRAVLEGVAGAYLDYLGGGNSSTGAGGDGNGTAALGGIWGKPCSRLEGAVYTAVPEEEGCVKPRRGGGRKVAERRFVVDESVGAVSVLAKDGNLEGAPTVFELRVVDGKLRYVHQFAATAAMKTEG